MSQQLYDYYQKNKMQSTQTKELKDKGLAVELTSTQKSMYKKCQRKLGLSKSAKEIAALEQRVLLELEGCYRGKEKSSVFLQKLEKIAYPQLTKLRSRAQKIIRQDSYSRFNVHFDPRLESSEIKVTAKIKEAAEVDQLIDELRQLPIKKWESFFAGEDEI